ncbi:hypothetical protein [Microvirga sp. M2]
MTLFPRATRGQVRSLSPIGVVRRSGGEDGVGADAVARRQVA